MNCVWAEGWLEPVDGPGETGEQLDEVGGREEGEETVEFSIFS